MEVGESSSSRIAKTSDHIMFSAGSDAVLYVNGIEKIRYVQNSGIASVSLNLFNGDVVGLKVVNKGGPLGIAAEIGFRDQRFVTGRNQWVAIRGNSASNAWLKPNYSLRSICSWKLPRILHTNFQSYTWTQPTAARSVWARGATSSDTIFLRYKIGGDNCAFESEIHFAADNFATLFINGNEVKSSSHWPEFVTLRQRLNRGDVVALRVRDEGVWWGAVLAINLKPFGGWHVTGKGEWRATKAFRILGDKNAWTSPRYNACAWPTPELRSPGKIVPGKAKDFPYSSTGAEYVWASNAGEGDEIFLRTVIGEGC